MAKPRIFVSSTYYDLRHIRKNLETFIKEMGYEPILFESGNIPFMHDKALDESCYAEIENSHMQILIIGGRYGNPSTEDKRKNAGSGKAEKNYELYNSITKKEYEKALEHNIHVFIFVEKGVHAEYETYKKNRENESIKYAHVDNTSIFKLLDEILGRQSASFVKDFENFDDIKFWLKEQWAGLFADYLSKKISDTSILSLSSQIDELKNTSESLKEYTKAIMQTVRPDDSSKIIQEEEKKILELRRQTLGNRFSTEPMISYIISNYALKEKDPAKIFEVFDKSKTVNEFIENLFSHKADSDLFLKRSISPAKRDFAEYKTKYLRERILRNELVHLPPKKKRRSPPKIG